MSKKYPLLCFFFLTSLFSFSQQLNSESYIVFLENKVGTNYSVQSPEQFLSPRSLAKRKRYHLAINEEDLPLSSVYLDEIRNVPNVKIAYCLKWSNAVVVKTDSIGYSKLLGLSFVKNQSSKAFANQGDNQVDKFKDEKILSSSKELTYGNSLTQTEMIQLDFLHNLGYKGEGMQIAVFDNGFKEVESIALFSKQFKENRIHYVKDIVGGGAVFENSGSHGTAVFSCMAADSSSLYVGTAPSADYFLFITESNLEETLLEEYHWQRAAEMADSMGIDIINSSLGYTVFNDSTQNHSYAELNGKTTPITIAANKAAEKGILVVCSAGNWGAKDWKYIGAPADGDQVFSVGAVNASEEAAPFSSFGPNSDGRVKPDVSALGAGIQVIATDGTLYYSNGTSFSAPVISGAIACLWQADSSFTNFEIMQMVKESAHLYPSSGEQMGYGIPNFNKAYESLRLKQIEHLAIDSAFVYPNPFHTKSKLVYYAKEDTEVGIEVFDILGNTIHTSTKTCFKGANVFEFDFFVTKGVYLLCLNNRNVEMEQIKWVKMD